VKAAALFANSASPLSLSLCLRVFYPLTRTYVKLLGPCFKTGQLKSPFLSILSRQVGEPDCPQKSADTSKLLPTTSRASQVRASALRHRDFNPYYLIRIYIEPPRFREYLLNTLHRIKRYMPSRHRRMPPSYLGLVVFGRPWTPLRPQVSDYSR